MKNKKKGGVSVLDAVIVILILALAASGVFHDEIRKFLGDAEETQVEYIFQIMDVTDGTISRPKEGETMTLLQGSDRIGTILSIEETPVQYRDEVNGAKTLYKLICRASATAEKTELGYEAAGTVLKKNAKISVRTETASFQMTVKDISEIAEEE